jgi:hypothetical protein
MAPVNDDLPEFLTRRFSVHRPHRAILSNHSCMSRRNGPISDTHCRMTGSSPPTGVRWKSTNGRLLKSAGTENSGFPVRIIERCVRYTFSARRGVNKPAATGVNTHVRKIVLGDSEEDEIARSQAGYLHLGALTVLFSSGAWNFYTGFTITVVHQATAVEAPRVRTTITIGNVNHVTCNGKSAVGA